MERRDQRPQGRLTPSDEQPNACYFAAISHFTDLIPTLITGTPAEGRELAIMIARKTIATIQPDADARASLRSDYDSDSAKLMQAGQIVAIEFQTIAAANNYWR